MINSKQYRNVPVVKKIEIKERLKRFAIEMHNVVYDIIGSGQGVELETLIKNNQVIVEMFDHSIGDLSAYGFEYSWMIIILGKQQVDLRSA